MSVPGQKTIFLIYYFCIIFLSINNFNIEELRSLYNFFNDKDKFMHFAQYFILVILGLSSFNTELNFKNFILILLFIMTTSAMAEFIQMHLSSRDSSYFDWLYDVFGGACGFLIFLGFNKICYKN